MESILNNFRDLILAAQSFVVLFVIAILYFLPSVIASRRKNKSANSIFVVNLFLGWTLLGWVIALAWSVSNQEEKK